MKRGDGAKFYAKRYTRQPLQEKVSIHSMMKPPQQLPTLDSASHLAKMTIP